MQSISPSITEALLADLMAAAPFQPATNWWRSVEIAHVLDHGLPEGLGLDLGCGDGRLTGIVLQRSQAGSANRHLVGVDMDVRETDQARSSGLYQRVHTCSAAQIPEATASFDFVFSNSVLEHIGPIDETLSEVSRLLRWGGQFLFTVPGPAFHACLKTPADPGQRDQLLHEIDQRCAHLRYWTEDQWRTALQRHGLKLTKTQAYLRSPAVQRWQTLAAWTSGMLYRWHQRKHGHTIQPIEIQHQLGLRAPQMQIPKSVAKLLAVALNSRRAVAAETDTGLAAGCLLLSGARR